MSSTILLTNNSDNYNLIQYFIESLTTLQILTQSYKVSRTLELFTIDNIEISKGTVKLNNIHFVHNPIFEKVENINYSTAIITDTDFINNILYFANNFSKSILESIIIINGQQYNCNKFVELGSKNYYILNQI
jgi:hypothetical protein